MRQFSLSSVGLGFAVLGLLLLTACTPEHPLSTFDPKGPVADLQATLFYFIFWASVIVFIVVEGALVYAVFRFRRSQRQTIPKQTHGNTLLEIAWTIAPTLVLAVVAVPTIDGIFRLADPDAQARTTGKSIVEVVVTGHQWWWEFEYPDLGITTANELHMPVGQVVNLTLRSDDVIHSFWIPKLGGKMDAIPTRSNKMWLQADEAGEYYGQCMELCGVAHANMRLRAFAHAEDDWLQWVERERSGAVSPTSLTGLALEGYELFENGACIACHTVRGSEKALGNVGPDLTHFGSRTTLASALLDSTPENIKAWLTDPSGVKPGALMPKLDLPDHDKDALVAYLQSLK